jgi:hypothetical protein
MRHRLARSLGTLAMEMPLPDVEKRAASSPPPAVADRDHVYAGPRAEEVASLAAGIAKAKSRLDYEQQQLTRASQLARRRHCCAAEPRPGAERRRGLLSLMSPNLKPIMPPPLLVQPNGTSSRRCASGGGGLRAGATAS